MRTGFVVIVDFRLKQGAREAFRALIDANAIASVREEAGCCRFDVMEVRAEADRVMEFDKRSAPLVAEKRVTTCDLVVEGTS